MQRNIFYLSEEGGGEIGVELLSSALLRSDLTLEGLRVGDSRPNLSVHCRVDFLD